MEKYKESQCFKAYIAGYRDGVADAYSGKAKTGISNDPAKIPVPVMGLQTRVCNCLLMAGCQTVADILALDDDAVRRMWNLGPKTASEIAHWLAEHYYFSPVWVQYL